MQEAPELDFTAEEAVLSVHGEKRAGFFITIRLYPGKRHYEFSTVKVEGCLICPRFGWVDSEGVASEVGLPESWSELVPSLRLDGIVPPATSMTKPALSTGIEDGRWYSGTCDAVQPIELALWAFPKRATNSVKVSILPSISARISLRYPKITLRKHPRAAKQTNIEST